VLVLFIYFIFQTNEQTVIGLLDNIQPAAPTDFPGTFAWVERNDELSWHKTGLYPMLELLKIDDPLQ